MSMIKHGTVQNRYQRKKSGIASVVTSGVKLKRAKKSATACV